MTSIKTLALASVLGATLFAPAMAQPVASTPAVGVGPQYDTTHVYMAEADLAAFATSFTATFGGHASAPATMTVTPTPSSTRFEAVQTPAGSLSVFGFTTPIPYGFGAERTGYLVTDMEVAIEAARAAGADVSVAPFPDPIGRDAIIQWPGGVNMQLYWHTTAPSYAPLVTTPENRLYLSKERADVFVRDFVAFSHGTVTQDDAVAPGVEIGRPGETYRRIRISSVFGKAVVLVTDGHLPWPYGREMTGYEVADLTATLAKAKAAGVKILVAPYAADHRTAAIVEFPGGYIAEVHAADHP
jgi:predicted enzyme related to lactoylglutathione lyase